MKKSAICLFAMLLSAVSVQASAQGYADADSRRPMPLALELPSGLYGWEAGGLSMTLLPDAPRTDGSVACRENGVVSRPQRRQCYWFGPLQLRQSHIQGYVFIDHLSDERPDPASHRPNIVLPVGKHCGYFDAFCRPASITGRIDLF